MSDTGSDVRSGIGARLRAGREKIGLTQLQAAEKLHVDAKVVEALETERYDVLGAPVFVRGHLKHFAELIGEQAPQLLELYAEATKPALPDLTRLPKAAPVSNPSRLAVPALVVLIGFVLVGVVWWVAKSVGGSEGTKPKRGPQPVVIAPEVTEEPAAVEGANSDVAAPGNAVGPPSGNTPANGPRVGNAVVPRGASATQGVGSSATPGGARPVPVAAGAASANVAPTAGATSSVPPPMAGTAAPAAAPVAARAKPMEVTLRFAADSWVEVYDASGEKLFYDVGSASSSHTVSGTPPFRVTVANAPGVTLDVNGKPAAVPANAVKGDEAQFVINRSGRIVRAPPKADGG